MSQPKPYAKLLQECTESLVSAAMQHRSDRQSLEDHFKRILAGYTDEQLASFCDFYSWQQAELHACTTGDCPHGKQAECSTQLIKEHKQPN